MGPFLLKHVTITSSLLNICTCIETADKKETDINNHNINVHPKVRRTTLINWVGGWAPTHISHIEYNANVASRALQRAPCVCLYHSMLCLLAVWHEATACHKPGVGGWRCLKHNVLCSLHECVNTFLRRGKQWGGAIAVY